MKIWLPYIDQGGGANVFIDRLAAGLTALGHPVVKQKFNHYFQYMPSPLKTVVPPDRTDAVIVNALYAFAFRRLGIKNIAVEHHCVLDPAYSPYCNLPQSIYYKLLVKKFESASLLTADAVVTVSQYTADSLHRALSFFRSRVIFNGIDTDFFCPGSVAKQPVENRPVRLLFTGNLTRRKGADLLPKIMSALGPGYELRYTTGLRCNDPFKNVAGMIPLGRLTLEQLREAYRYADLLLFPTRFEGFGYTVAEALACGTPVVTTRCSSLPEIVDDGVTGMLCRLNDVYGFSNAVKELVKNKEKLVNMGHQARGVAVQRFSLQEMTKNYIELLNTLPTKQ